MTAKKAAGHSSKHVSSHKHGGTSKHHPSAAKKSPAGHTAAKVHAKAKHATHAKARGFAIGDLLPVCAFEALAMSLRLAGQLVDDDEAAWLWELTGAAPLGASLASALDSARLHGLAGFRPQAHRLVTVPVGAQDDVPLPRREQEAVPLFGPVDDLLPGDFHALILGIDVPGPHAVLATAGGWWSWGELHSPWPARVEEAWAVSWS